MSFMFLVWLSGSQKRKLYFGAHFKRKITKTLVTFWPERTGTARTSQIPNTDTLNCRTMQRRRPGLSLPGDRGSAMKKSGTQSGMSVTGTEVKGRARKTEARPTRPFSRPSWWIKRTGLRIAGIRR